MRDVMMWLPGEAHAVMPLITMLFDSVAPLVKMISDAPHPRRLATRSRACSMPALHATPKLWLLEGLPYLSLR